MGKFRIRVKLQGFELEVDGDRDDIPAITSAVQRQLGGLVTPPDTDPDNTPEAPAAPIIDLTNGAKRRPARKRGAAAKVGDVQQSGVIEFRHDSGKFGTPKQGWSVVQKCIWLLYVIRELQGVKEAGASQLTATYNSQFKAAGKIHPPHTPRDLGMAKVASPAPVGEDKGMWFLTDEGVAQAKELVKQGLGNP
jgi:hypothetical protein